MLYDMRQGPPPPGSLQEVVCALVQQSRREQDLLRTMLLVPTVEPKQRAELLEAYKHALAPYLAAEQGRLVDRMKAMSDNAFRQGPIYIALTPEQRSQ